MLCFVSALNPAETKVSLIFLEGLRIAASGVATTGTEPCQTERTHIWRKLGVRVYQAQL